MKSITSILLIAVGVIITTTVFLFSAYTKPTEGDKTTKTTADAAPDHDGVVQQINIPKIPDSLTFAGEPVPMDDMEMRERFDREMLSICFWHSTTIQNIKLANRYFPYIEEIMKKHGIPDDFKYLAVTESNLRNATSPAGAKGIWQFMSATAKTYGLTVTKEVDERLNFFKTTEAACKLLKNLKEKFGSWTLAAAAYNCGEGRVKERMSEQKGSSYYDIVLPEETMRYVPRILAMKEILRAPEKYGFQFDKNDFYAALPKYKTVIVNTSISHWPDFCQQHNISYRALLVHNPWIMGYTLSNTTGKAYEVMIPE